MVSSLVSRKPHPLPRPLVTGSGPLEKRDSCAGHTVGLEEVSEEETVTAAIEED